MGDQPPLRIHHKGMTAFADLDLRDHVPDQLEVHLGDPAAPNAMPEYKTTHNIAPRANELEFGWLRRGCFVVILSAAAVDARTTIVPLGLARYLAGSAGEREFLRCQERRTMHWSSNIGTRLSLSLAHCLSVISLVALKSST